MTKEFEGRDVVSEHLSDTEQSGIVRHGTEESANTIECKGKASDYQNGSSVMEYGLLLAGLSAVMFAFFNSSNSGLDAMLKSNFSNISAEIGRVSGTN